MLNLSGAGLIVAAIGVTAVAASGGWLARGVVVDRFEIPRVIEHQVEICTAETTAVAAQATRDEQLRQFRLGELASEQFINASQAADDDHRAELDVLEMEIERYAQRVAGTGRICALDTDDLDLLGVHPKQNGAVPGSK